MILSPKHLPRLVSTVRLFTNYGLRDFANRQGLLSLNGDGLDDLTPVAGDTRAKARAFRERLVELGPAYIKLGQVLSTRPDLLPKPYIEELVHLQDDVPPMSFPPATMSTPPGTSLEVPVATGSPMSAAVKWERSGSPAEAGSAGKGPAAMSDKSKRPVGFIRCRDMDSV